mgnify:CR=1 FL=1
MALLSLRNVTRRFGGIVALDGISFDVWTGQIVGLIGPNGAGKTTAFNVITRLYTPNEGEVEFDGETLLKTPRARHRAARDRAHLPERRAVQDDDRAATTCSSARTRAAASVDAEALEVLDYVGLGAIAQRPVAALPFGTLKRVELARALVSQPALLLLDEPAGGPQPRGGRRISARFIQQTPRRPRADRAPRRAPHEPRDGDLRPRAA